MNEFWYLEGTISKRLEGSKGEKAGVNQIVKNLAS